jgi:dienelactone hydrolase
MHPPHAATSMRSDRQIFPALLLAVLCTMLSDTACGVQSADTSRGDQMLAAYFRSETQKISDACLANIKTWNDWTSRREKYRQQLREMLGLDPLPERTSLAPVITGTLERDDFKVEKLYFQSRPHLYVTANLYMPKKQSGRVPAILYLCGHTPAKKDGVSLGNKTKYQHHGAWFAQNGYACLVIDTLQMGEIEGIHHGTYKYDMWWWNSRGYTPAGVEVWNAIRAIDYLVSRHEVDPERIGVTGRSGGGAYTWYVTALDERVKAAVPVAGITTLKNHVVDGCVEGHCDCMYFVNTYRWDFPQLAALAAPRPLLIANTDRDTLFPLDGVVDLYQKTRRIYELSGNGDKIALQIAAGPHEDLQVLQLHALTWFNQHLKHENPLVETAAKDYFKPEQLKVFDKLPDDQINMKIQESFVPQALAPNPPVSQVEWESQRDKWMTALREKVFRGWPAKLGEWAVEPAKLLPNKRQYGRAMAIAYSFRSDEKLTLPIYIFERDDPATTKIDSLIVEVLDAKEAADIPPYMKETKADEQHVSSQNASRDTSQSPADGPKKVFAYIPLRGMGPSAWNANDKKQTHIRRRFMLLGQTLDSMRVWDVRRAIQSLRRVEGLGEVPITLIGRNETAAIALYAALFEPSIESVELETLPHTHRDGADFLNVQRFLDVPQVIAMVAEKSHVVIYDRKKTGWEFPLAVARRLNWHDRIEIDDLPGEEKHPANAASSP